MLILSSEAERVVLVHVDFSTTDPTDNLAEFVTLANSSGVIPISVITGACRHPNAKYFVGHGKVLEIQQAIAAYAVDCVIFNHPLSSSQQRNLEQALGIRVLNRTELILDIFAQRARTYEAKLQVELAQLQHLSTRLVRGWAHLGRQKGGIGLRGPGEMQLETDRRLLCQRITVIKKRLQKVRQQRQQGRQRRKRQSVPVVALVGYTNAGKSTLFNLLTDAKAYVADKLFATLDPTLRRLPIAALGDVILVDTVGFIRHLPHDLINVFRVTLEEITAADLLLHVIDASDPHMTDTISAVDSVLHEINAHQIMQLKVYNKIDRLPGVSAHAASDAIWISATNQQGGDSVCQAIKLALQQRYVTTIIKLLPQQASIRAHLYDLHGVQQEIFTDSGYWQLQVRLPLIEYQRLQLSAYEFVYA